MYLLESLLTTTLHWPIDGFFPEEVKNFDQKDKDEEYVEKEEDEDIDQKDEKDKTLLGSCRPTSQIMWPLMPKIATSQKSVTAVFPVFML